jgi:hypothetical protein
MTLAVVFAFLLGFIVGTVAGMLWAANLIAKTCENLVAAFKKEGAL